VHPQHFASDPADILIGINPEIRIGIAVHFSVDISALVEFALSECSCSSIYNCRCS